MTRIYDEVAKGIDLLWGNKFREAEELFVTYASVDPRHALHYSEAAFFKGILSELASDRQLAISRFEKAIALAEDHSKYYDSGSIPKGVNIDAAEIPNYALDAHIVAADGYTMLATLQLMEDSRLKGLLNMRRAWKNYRELIGKAEKLGADMVVQNSLKFGAGLFYFLISMIPPGMAQRAAALAGFRGGDKNLGLQYLRDCHNARSIRSMMAGMVLSLNHLFLTIPFEENGGEALLAEVNVIINEGLEKYPEGSLFRTFAAVAELEKGNTLKAIVHVNEGIKYGQTVVTTTPPLFLRLTVNCYAMDLDWNKCIEILEKLREQEKAVKSKYNWSASWNYLRLGSCYMMVQNTEKSKQCYESVLKEKSGEKWVQDLKQQASKFLKTGGVFSMFELMYLTGHFYKLIKNSTHEKRKDLVTLLDKMAENTPGCQTNLFTLPRPTPKSRFNVFARAETLNLPEVDNRGIYLVLKATVLWSMKQYEQSEELVTEVINNAELFANDKLYYVMALIIHARSIAHVKTSEAIVLLETAMKISGYPWENNLKGFCRRLLEQYGVTEIKVDEAEIPDDQVEKLLEEEEEEAAN